MAIRYFDANGTTAGFGTLTGNWNSTGPTVGWSSSAAGTGAVGAYTFTSADEAVFGVAGQTATGGTVTIPTGLNVTLNKITTANISGQTISYGGTGTLTFAGTNPTINDNSPLTISVPLAGTGGVTKIGTANPLRIKVPGTISGTYAQTSGQHTWVGAEPSALGPTANVLPNITDFNIQAGIYYIWNSNNAGYTYAGQFRGAGTVLLTQANTTNAASNTIAFPSLQNWTGTFLLWSNSTTANRYAFASVAVFPTSPSADIQYKHEDNNTSGIEKRLIIPASATGHSTPVKLTVYTSLNSPITNALYRLDANQTSTGSNGMTFSGAVQRIDGGINYTSIGPLTLTLGGTNTDANTISGLISSAANMGVLALAKADAGRWVLSNANTYTGGTTISGGFLRAINAQAFGVTGGITLSGGTMELAGVSPANTALNTVGTISVVSGTSTLTQQITMGGSTTLSADSGATLILNNTTNAITGVAAMTLGGDGTVEVRNQITLANGLTKSGSGTARLTNANNSFTAAPSITAGVLEVATLAAASTNSPLGAGTSVSFSGSGVLRYTGSTGATLSRSVSGSSLNGAGFENTGSGSLAVTAGTLSGTIKLGAATDGAGQFNTLSTTISSGAFTKDGAGRWISTGSNDLAGATTVTTGTLMGANADGATKRLLGGNVTVAAGAKIQLGSDNDQKGRNRYDSLTFNGTSGNPARIRIGGSAVSPTVQMSGNLTISGSVTWDLTADTFKTPGTYTLIEFTGFGALAGGQASLANVTMTTPTGRTASNLTYNTPVGGPNTITVQIS